MTLAMPARPSRLSPLAGPWAQDRRPALIDANGTLTYADLDLAVDAAIERRGPADGRRLVLLEAAPTRATVIEHLACLRSGDPVLLVPPGRPDDLDRWVDIYDPDVVLTADADGSPHELRRCRHHAQHRLHPELAVLLSTSGTTGSPKLVRLSMANVEANARQIVAALGLRSSDRCLAQLTPAYAMGLSVLHSALHAGASLVLTDRSVVDPCFWSLARSARASVLATVPHGLELLERSGSLERSPSHLRLVVQAGGRAEPELMQRMAGLGRRRGWDLVPMYGQTEATARIACSTTADAAQHPDAVGFPVPGTQVRLVPVDGAPPGSGELVVRGPQVMLGYAMSPADLARGRDIAELRTGDLATIDEDGRLRIVGRTARIVKVMGLRVDLERVDAALRDAGLVAWSAVRDDVVGLVVEGGRAESVRAMRGVRRLTALPASAVVAVPVARLPRTMSGKVDGAAVAALVEGAREARAAGSSDDTVRTADDLVRVVGARLGRPDARPSDSFVDLGGDSLSYVEVSVLLERVLGRLPDGWHVQPLGELARLVPDPADASTARKRRPLWAAMETGAVLRALAILAVVGSHIGVFGIRGGAHVLLAAAGYAFARFLLTDVSRVQRLKRGVRSLGRVAVPSMLWIALVVAIGDEYRPTTALLLNTVVAHDDLAFSSPDWRYWFVEALVHLLLLSLVLLSLPWIDRLTRQRPLVVPLALVAAGLLTRYDVVSVAPGPSAPYTPAAVLWLFALGWAAAVCRSTQQRLLVSAVVIATVPGFFPSLWRTAFIVGGILLLIWARTVPVPRVLVRPLALLAAASLAIYLTHWQVFPPLLEAWGRWPAFIGAVIAGVMVNVVVVRSGRAAAAVRQARRSRRPDRSDRSEHLTDRPLVQSAT